MALDIFWARAPESYPGTPKGDLLHTDAFTQTLLHTYTFTHMHTDAFTHTCFCTQAHTRIYTQTLLPTDAFTHKRFYTQTLLHTNAFTHRRFYTQTLSHAQLSYYAWEQASQLDRPQHNNTFHHMSCLQCLPSKCPSMLGNPLREVPQHKKTSSSHFNVILCLGTPLKKQLKNHNFSSVPQTMWPH